MKTQLQEKRIPAVRIGRGRQVVIPKKIHDVLELKPGDFLDVELKDNQVVFTPKSIIDREITLGLQDFQEGRFIGPFKTAKEAIRALHRARKSAKR